MPVETIIGLPMALSLGLMYGLGPCLVSCLPYLGPECGACNGYCPVPGAMHWQHERPSINDALCTGCGLCREACVIEPKAISITLLKA